MNEVALQAIAGGVLGAVAGSFLATLAMRWPAGRSVLRGRSACDGCGVTIAPWRLVPLLSYAVVRGRCADCGAAIDWRHPVMEAMCAAIGGVALLVAPGWAGWSGALLGWMLAALALLDFDHFWLPDRLTLPLVVLGLLVGEPLLVDRVIGALAGWLMLAAAASAYRRARGRIGLGQGDAKLLGAIGAWLGWQPLPWVVLAACMIGLGVALIGRLRSGDRLPFGTLLAGVTWPIWIGLHVF